MLQHWTLSQHAHSAVLHLFPKKTACQYASAIRKLMLFITIVSMMVPAFLVIHLRHCQETHATAYSKVPLHHAENKTVFAWRRLTHLILYTNKRNAEHPIINGDFTKLVFNSYNSSNRPIIVILTPLLKSKPTQKYYSTSIINSSFAVERCMSSWGTRPRQWTPSTCLSKSVVVWDTFLTALF